MGFEDAAVCSQQSMGRGGSDVLFPRSQFQPRGRHLPRCRAEAQICKRKPRHPPDPSRSSLFDETIPGPWLFYARSRTACCRKGRGEKAERGGQQPCVYLQKGLPRIKEAALQRALFLWRGGGGSTKASSRHPSFPHCFTDYKTQLMP